jgi:hypothetical protein
MLNGIMWEPSETNFIKIGMGSMGWNSFTLVHQMWLSLLQFAQNLCLYENFFKESNDEFNEYVTYDLVANKDRQMDW